MYQVVIELIGKGRVYKPKESVFSFKETRFALTMSEGFIPAQGEYLTFKHEGEWWTANITEKNTAILRENTVRFGYWDTLVTLKLGTVFQADPPEMIP